jgi:hypothetical protein
MSDKNTPPKPEDTVTMSKSQLEDIMARLAKVETPADVGNPVIAKTCNSCGKSVDEKTGRCVTHPNEHVNHIANGLDVETGLKRPAIKFQTRAA